MDNYDFKKIEENWQSIWKKNKLASCDVTLNKNNFYNLCMYPYPSGDLHMGHIRNYTMEM